MKLTQKSEILKHLKRGKTITSKEAYDRFGATRLSAIIYDLRNRNKLDIKTEMVEVPTRYGNKKVARYKLVEEQNDL